MAGPRVHRPPGLAVVLGALALLGTPTVSRAQLTWGVNGAGGAGTWNATAANWYDGTNNVAWDGTTAVFAGTAGTVSAAVFLPLQGMVFNVAGYTISNGYFLAPGNLTVTTNADATLNSVVASNTFGATFIKNGTGTLTDSSSNFFGNVQLNAGQYVATSIAASFFSTFNLANAAGTVLTLGGTGSSGSLAGLNGGGAAGGVVRPGTQGGTLSATNFGGGSFAGVLEDNGSTRLAYTQFSTGVTQTLTAANSYTGATTVNAGTLAFAGSGSASATSAVSVIGGAVLTLDNSGTALGSRLPSAAPVSVTGGEINLVGNTTTAVTQSLGALQYSGATTLNATQPGSATTMLGFAGITRGPGATLNVSGSGAVGWTGIANGSNGIIGPSVTVGNEWAVAGPNGTAQPLTNYATNPATAGAADHVKITGAATALPTAATATWNTLNLQNAAASTQTVDVGTGQTLVLAGGGLLSSGSGPAAIGDGTLATSGELIVTNHNALTIGSAIGETAANTVLTKSGEGTLVLTGTNTYTGATQITEGTLAVSRDANLGSGTAIAFDGGSLQANGSFTTAKNLTQGTAVVGSINTNGYNVTVTGTNTSIQQTGTGVLTLTSAATGSTYTTPNGGTLALPNAASGTSTIQGGTLQAAGTLSGLNVRNSGTLDVGGSDAQTLTLNNFSELGGNAVLTVLFTLASTTQDRLAILAGEPSYVGIPTILFTINQPGTLQTGVSYTLINLPNGSAGYLATEFGLSPQSTAAGYQGTFTVGANAVTISFSAVPEPSARVLLGIAGAAALGAAARRRKMAVRPK